MRRAATDRKEDLMTWCPLDSGSWGRPSDFPAGLRPGGIRYTDAAPGLFPNRLRVPTHGITFLGRKLCR